jgi:hypothetical protein
MKPSSAKNKGRKGQKEIKQLLHKYFTGLDDGDIDWRSMGAGGTDLILSPRAEEEIGPLKFEIKFQSNPPWEPGLDQAKDHVEEEHHIPIYVRRRNYEDWIAVIPFEELLRLKQIWCGDRSDAIQRIKQAAKDL